MSISPVRSLPGYNTAVEVGLELTNAPGTRPGRSLSHNLQRKNIALPRLPPWAGRAARSSTPRGEPWEFLLPRPRRPTAPSTQQQVLCVEATQTPASLHKYSFSRLLFSQQRSKEPRVTLFVKYWKSRCSVLLIKNRIKY